MAYTEKTSASKNFPRGGWKASYRSPEGRERSKTFERKVDAERWLTSVEHAKLSGAYVDPAKGKVTLSAWATQWLTTPGKRPSAWARDEAIVRVHLVPALGARGLGTITPGDVQALVKSWAEGAAPRTVRRQYGVLRAILNAAVMADIITRSPCRGIRLPALEQKARHVVDVDELSSLAKAMPVDYRPMVYLGTVLGLRWGECAGLRVGRLDFLRSTISITEQLTRGPGGVMVAGPPKSQAGRRTLAVPTALMAMLSDVLARRGLTGVDVDEIVFTAPEGGPLDYSHFRRRVWLPGCRAAGLGGLTFHDLRRANATGMVLDGVDLKTAQVRLGHSDPRLTLAVYAQATSAADVAAAERLGDRFMNVPRPARGLSAV